MSINTTTLKANLTTKINNTTGTTDAKEFLLLGKAVEAVANTGIGSNDVDFGSYKITYSNNYAQLNDLPNAAIYHGMFAHVHATGKGYFSHAGNWLPLVNEDTSGNVSLGGNLTVTGNFTVNGTTTTINSTTLDVDDLNITVASGAVDANAANGAGITVDGASASLTYTATTDTWDFNKAISGSYVNLHPQVTTTSAAATSQTFDMNKPMNHMNMTAATQFSGVNLAAGKTSMMVLDTTATPHAPTWNADIKWPSATEPTWSDYRYWVVSLTCLNSTTILASASGYTV